MDFDRLIKLVREEKVSLFIGSGFSLKTGAPSVATLCKGILSQIDNEQICLEHKNDSLAKLSNYYVEEVCCGSRNNLIELLQNMFSFTPTNTEDQQALAQIPHFHDIFTTNYDTLLEDAYDKHNCQIIRKDADCAYIDKNKAVRIFKIHGDFENQDFIIVTSKDYDDYFKNNRNQLMWNEVKSHFLTDHILFIGYSLEDDNIIDIIKNISKAINKNQKEMFLIAPGFDGRKQGQLKKMKVHYYDSLATDFFAELIQQLKDNIWNDFKHHKVTAETFSRFCNIHDIAPEVAIKPDTDNQIVKYKSLDGKDLRHEINMTVVSKNKEMLDNLDFEKYGVQIKNSPFPNLPVLPIKKEELSSFSIRVNGLLIRDTAESVYLAPLVNKKTITIRIPSRQFLQKTETTVYSPRKGKIVYNIDCHIYNIKIEFELKDPDDEKSGMSVNLNLKFKDNYTDNNAAINWIELLCAFFSKEEIFINEYSQYPANTSFIDKVDVKYADIYSKFKTYYENIKQIELLTGITFTKYNCYTDESYKNSCIIASYLKHEPIYENCPNGVDFSTEDHFSDDFIKMAKSEAKFSAFSTVPNQNDFVLNDRKFTIKNALHILAPSVVTNITKLHNGKMKIDFHCDSKTIKVLYTDKTTQEEIPTINSISFNSIKE